MIRILVFSTFLLSYSNTMLLGGSKPDDDVKVTKEISRGFKFVSGCTIDLITKYGKVELNQWENDSVGILVRVAVYGKDESDVQQQIRRINFDFRNTSNFITLETIFNVETPSAKELLGSFFNSKRSISSNNKTTVDYTLYLPKNASVNITNKYGDVLLGDHSGKLKVDLVQGNIFGGAIQGFADFNFGFGTMKLSSLGNTRIAARGAKIDLDTVNDLELISSSSNVMVGKVKHLKLESKNDVLNFKQIERFFGKTLFSSVAIEELFENVTLESFYGEIVFNHLSRNFSKVEVIAKSTNISVTVDPASSFQYELIGNSEDISLPAEFADITSKIDTQNEKLIRLDGKYGYSNSLGKLSLESSRGLLRVFMQTPPPVTKNKK